MDKLQEQLNEIKQKNRIGLMTHVVIGYPSLEDTVMLVKLMEQCGVDMVELQIPFSDPLADGPTIMKACEKSIANGTKVKDAFEIAKQLSQEVSIPLLFMAYYNTVFRYGTKKFCEDAKAVGISGLIVPDVPLDEEENEHFIEYCRENNLADIRVISPASTMERLRKNAKVATGFVYCTARQGITGAKSTLNPKIKSYLEQASSIFEIPLAVGFGISKKEHIDSLKENADIAIVGSALIDVINSSKNNELERNIQNFLTGLQEGN